MNKGDVLRKLPSIEAEYFDDDCLIKSLDSANWMGGKCPNLANIEEVFGNFGPSKNNHCQPRITAAVITVDQPPPTLDEQTLLM